MIDTQKIKKDFPQTQELHNGKRAIYLDSAATTLKALPVVESITQYYLKETANIHRGIHYLSELNTTRCEDARLSIQKFINARSEKEIIFTRSTTESLNLVALTWGDQNIKKDDEIIITELEHHSNIVPWQMLCNKKEAKLKIARIDDNGDIDIDYLKTLINPKTKLASFTYISNALGTVNPIIEVTALLKSKGVTVVIDAAQAMAHESVDVQKIDCDFLAFSGHKMFGPTGIGVLYGKENILENTDPVFGGGSMIDKVTFEKTTYNHLPHKFEAGTPHISGILGLGKAVEYIQSIGLDNIKIYEGELLKYAEEELNTVSGLTILGNPKHRNSVLSFTLNEAHPHDIATILNKEGVAIRTGTHCTQPLLEKFKLTATARASIAFYNTKEDIDELVKALRKIQELFG